jgi:hypothetical protein
MSFHQPLQLLHCNCDSLSKMKCHCIRAQATCLIGWQYRYVHSLPGKSAACQQPVNSFAHLVHVEVDPGWCSSHQLQHEAGPGPHICSVGQPTCLPLLRSPGGGLTVWVRWENSIASHHYRTACVRGITRRRGLATGATTITGQRLPCMH